MNQENNNLHPTPHALHPTPYTLHPTPHTLRPASYTLHPTPYTLHITPYIWPRLSYTCHIRAAGTWRGGAARARCCDAEYNL